MVAQVPANDSDLTIAQDALRTGDTRTVQRLLAAEPGLIHQRTEPEGDTLLHIAACGVDTYVVEMLVAAGADLEATAGEGWRPLHNAAGMGSTHVLKNLLEAGADPLAEACGSGGTALVHALFHGYHGTAKLLATYAYAPANLRVAAGLGDTERIAALVPVYGQPMATASSARGFFRHHAEYPMWTPTTAPQEVLDEALVYAAHNGQREAVDLLLAKGACINGRPYYATALHQAVIMGDRVMVAHLLARGADPTMRDGMHGGRPADWARYSPSPGLAEPLLAAAAETDLSAAVEAGLEERVVQLAQAATIESLTAAYCVAARSQAEDLAALLISRGAKPGLFDYIALGNNAAVRAALDAGANPDEGRTMEIERMGEGLVSVAQSALQAAAAAHAPEIGRSLAFAGAELDPHSAAFLGRIDALEVSYEKETYDVFGMTPLHRAIQGGSIEAVRWLLSNGASVLASSDTYTFGGRALHVAATTDASEALIDALLNNGADLKKRMNPGTPLDVAIRHDQPRTADILKARGA